MDEVNITVYATFKELLPIEVDVETLFNEVLDKISITNEEDKKLFEIEFKDQTNLNGSIATDEVFMKEHVNGMANFYASVEMENEELLSSVIKQIQLFNGLVGFHFYTDDNEARTNYIINTIFELAKKWNGFVLFQSMELYTHDSKLLISYEGKSDFEVYYPTVSVDFFEEKEQAIEDMERKQRSIKKLQEKEIPYIEHLRVSVLENEACIRSKEEIAQRLIAMFAIALYSEVRLSNETREEALFFVEMLDKRTGGKLYEWFSVKENEYIHQEELNQEVAIPFSWRYEGCNVLMWALNLTSKLEYPSHICNVSDMAKIIWNIDTFEELLEKAIVQDIKTILDEQDLILRYDWACVDARVKQQEVSGELNAGVVYERHYALNWLVEDVEWDRVQTNT